MSFWFWVPGPADRLRQGWEVWMQLANLCWETWAGKPGQCFLLKKTPKPLELHISSFPPSSNPSSSSANPVGRWPGKCRIFPKALAPYLSSEEAGWIPLCWAPAGKQSWRTGVFGCWSFLKAEHKFSFLLVDGFIICSEIKSILCL